MEQILSRSAHALQSPPHRAPQSGLLALLRRWQLNRRTRQQLALLDERLLADAGISPNERNAELDKAFWQ
ncbi:DUF1127 domain-containing protein [Pseudomonas sp. GD03944]|uniref:DUF1127 domain-containing protein n=1 Tax=Pseudomonas sp. GD03944 TaxID=2975409 RepID=UPI0024498898|nr:DUF1127 domain-containing protein [Pseudomonas sp. GD03944]MDH1265703.1 DUF1127 domain-containing protein [Pseudomonas sp. GD03944]